MKQLFITSYCALVLIVSTPGHTQQCIDHDGDGWGWDGTSSCLVTAGPIEDAVCFDSPPTGDGWGWDGTSSCRIQANNVDSTCFDSEPLGDGWGWNGVESCRVTTSIIEPVIDDCIDSPPLGDGWGWNGIESCMVAAADQRLRSVQGNGDAMAGLQLSADLNFALLQTYNNTLYENDLNNTIDVFIRSTQDQSVELVSIGSNGEAANGNSQIGEISANGQFAVFSSDADNIKDNPSNGSSQIYRYDRATQAINMLSIGADGQPGNGNSILAMTNGDASTVVFQSQARNLVADGRASWGIYVAETSKPGVTRVNNGLNNSPPNGMAGLQGLSANGRYVLYDSTGDNHVEAAPADLFEVELGEFAIETKFALFLYDTMIRSTVQVPVWWNPNESWGASVSNDGKVVYAPRLDGVYQVILVDVQANTWDLLSTESGSATPAPDSSYNPKISPDGRYVAYLSKNKNLLADRRLSGERLNLFLVDTISGVTTLVSQSDEESSSNVSEFEFTSDNRYLHFSNSARETFVYGLTN